MITRKVQHLTKAARPGTVCWQCRISQRNAYRPLLVASPAQMSRFIHTSLSNRANPLPLGGTAAGPPPEPPKPHVLEIPKGRLIQAAYPKPTQERFWKDVHLKLVDGSYQVLLDKRQVRTASKRLVTIPTSKPLLAHALQVEWGIMRNSKEALKPHLIPLTSLVGRAIDLEEAEKAGKPEELTSSDDRLKGTRNDIVDFLMAYLDTDTMLMISPTRGGHLAGVGDKQLRDQQLEAAQDMISWVRDNMPVPEGEEKVGIIISDGDHGILPNSQSDRTKSIIKKLISELSAWELVGLERAVIISKSLLVGLRLVLENRKGGSIGWDVEDAAKACNLETDFQIEQWGFVEDTHDVNHVDLRRGLGSVVLLVSEVDFTEPSS